MGSVETNFVGNEMANQFVVSAEQMAYINSAPAFAHIADQAARVFIYQLRHQFGIGATGVVYGARYVRQLAQLCKYNQVGHFAYQVGLRVRNFKSAREAGQFMENTIDGLFQLGVMR